MRKINSVSAIVCLDSAAGKPLISRPHLFSVRIVLPGSGRGANKILQKHKPCNYHSDVLSSVTHHASAIENLNYFQIRLAGYFSAARAVLPSIYL